MADIAGRELRRMLHIVRSDGRGSADLEVGLRLGLVIRRAVGALHSGSRAFLVDLRHETPLSEKLDNSGPSKATFVSYCPARRKQQCYFFLAEHDLLEAAPQLLGGAALSKITSTWLWAT